MIETWIRTGEDKFHSSREGAKNTGGRGTGRFFHSERTGASLGSISNADLTITPLKICVKASARSRENCVATMRQL